MAETWDKNMIDKDEYPPDRRDRGALRKPLARLVWMAPAGRGRRLAHHRVSEAAAMLGGIELKWRWARAEAQGCQPRKPNL